MTYDVTLSWIRQEASWCLQTGLAPPLLSPWLLRWCNFASVPTRQDRPPFTAPRLIQYSLSGVWGTHVSHRSVWFVAGICQQSLSVEHFYDLARLVHPSWVYKPFIINLTFINYIQSLTLMCALHVRVRDWIEKLGGLKSKVGGEITWGGRITVLYLQEI